MKFIGILAPGQESDKDLSARVENVLKEYGDRLLFNSKEECIKTVEVIKSKLSIIGLMLEWLRGSDTEQHESVVFCGSRSVTIPYAIGYLHFYKSRN